MNQFSATQKKKQLGLMFFIVTIFTLAFGIILWVLQRAESPKRFLFFILAALFAANVHLCIDMLRVDKKRNHSKMEWPIWFTLIANLGLGILALS